MPHGSSQMTKIISIRVPNDVYDTLKRRAESSMQYRTVGSYVQDRLIYDTRRKHGTPGKPRAKRQDNPVAMKKYTVYVRQFISLPGHKEPQPVDRSFTVLAKTSRGAAAAVKNTGVRGNMTVVRIID